MTTVQSKISATNHKQFITVDKVAAVKGHSIAHTRRSFRLVKVLAGLNIYSHSVHIDVLILHAQSIPALMGLRHEDFLSIN